MKNHMNCWKHLLKVSRTSQSAAEPQEKDWGRFNDYRKYNLEEKFGQINE